MWQRLSVLALCGMSALWADACDGLPTGPPGIGGPVRDPAEPAPPFSFQLSEKPGGPTFRITVRTFSFVRAVDGIFKPVAPNDWPNNGDVAGDIEVARCQDGKPLQLLPIMADIGINFAATFGVDDINFDGYLDFSVLSGPTSAGRSDPYSYWVYDPGSGLFVQNELTQELGEKSNVMFDPNKHEISWFFIPSPPTPSCAVGGRYRVENNRLILIQKVEITRSTQGPLEPDQPYCTVTVSDLIGGTMRVTEVWRVDALVGQPVK